MTFKDCYKFPLKVDDYCPVITWTADKQRAFDWLINATLEQKQQLVNVVNGANSDKKFKNQFYREGIHIYSKAPELKDVPILRVRGWGYLTGTGGLHLSEEEAIKIQNEFGDYIVEQLNKN